MPLSDCIRKAGKALSSRDATAIQTLADDFEASGMLRQEAEQKAIEQHVTALQGEVDAMLPGDLELAQKQDQTETPEFKTWFGDSKVVDAEGKPLVMYHGTTKSFNVFDTKTYGALLGKGAYFTSDKEDARQYSGEGVKGVTPRIVETYIKVQNPYEVSTVLGSVPKQDELIAQGYDGIIRRNAEGGVKWAVAFEPNQIKSATGNKGTFDPNDPNILNQADNLGFVSELSRKIQDAPFKQAPAASWKDWVQSLTKKGVKPDEIEWSGINEWLDLQEGKVTQEQVAEFLANNGVQVEEVVLGGKPSPIDSMSRDELAAEYEQLVGYNPVEDDPDISDADLRELVRGAATEQGTQALPKYTDYQLPGGENYREVLLTLPAKEVTQFFIAYTDGSTIGSGFISRADAEAEMNDLFEGRSDIEVREGTGERSTTTKTQQNFKSTHWDQPNVLAHIRLNDRADRDGKKVLFVEEIQSDWGQEGKKEGFADNKEQAAIKKELEPYGVQPTGSTSYSLLKSKGVPDELIDRWDNAYMRASMIPSAPFVTATDKWLSLAMKRVVKIAVDEGYDRVSFVTGEQSADRYDLSKKIDRVEYSGNDGVYEFSVYDLKGKEVMSENDAPISRIEELFGKSIAEKMEASEGEKVNDYYKSLSGLDLQVGGEGMKAFYDQIVPKVAKKISGQSLKPVDVGTNTDQLSFDITPELKAKVEAGQSLFQQEGNLPRGTTLMNPNAPVISLSTASDMSTFLHETMHLFMLMEQQFAKEFGITDNQRALLESVGVESFDQLTREHHEQLAESFEVYLREGKAPSVKLMDAFNTFRAWLLQVYKSLRNLPNQKLDDKMRAAFDRLLATEEEIQQAAASPAFMQMFRTKEQAGMTDAEWKAYQEAKAKRDGRAITTIEEKIIRQLKQRKTKEWKQERDVLAKEELARLSELPVYKILANTLKRTDDDMARPMDRESIKVLLGVKNVTGAWIRRTSNDGTDPQLVSEAYGYATVEDMVQEMNDALPIQEAATEAAEARMKEKYGDILNDGTMEAEVMTALHNVKDVDKLYAELRALDSTQTLNRDLLKAEARRIIGTMKNSEIRPSKFHQNMIRAAQRAATSGSKAEKVMAKQQQLVNHYLYKEAVKAKQEADKFTKYVNKVKTRKYNTRQVHPDHVHAMKMLANLYTAKSKTTDADIKKLLDFYKGQEEAMTGVTLIDPQLIVAAEAVARGDTITPIMMKNMTMTELRGLYLSLKNLRFVGGRESEARAEAFRQQTAALTESVLKHGGPDRPESIAPGPLDNLTRNISGFLKSLPSLRNFMRWLDGGDDYGEAFKQIYRPIEDANNNKMRMHRELYERFEAELSQIDQVSLKRYGAKKITLDDGRVVPIHGEARFMIALYWGTESSREAIRQGHGFTDNDAARIMADMSKPELELLNAVWRLNESIWPDIAKAHKDRTGVVPEKLAPTPFVVNGVELTGGHMRLYYLKEGVDPNTFNTASDGQFDSLVTAKSGTMIERVGSGGRRVLLDKGNITRAINDAIHYTAFANPSVELAAIMNNDSFQNAVRLKHGDVFYNQLVETMRSVVTDRKDRDVAAWLASGARYLRRNLTAMHLMYSIRNVVQQVTALPLVLEEVGPANFVKALGDFVVPGNEHVKFINESSEFMRNRAELVNREAHEQLHNIAFGGPVTRGLKTLNDYGFFMQTTVDSVFAYPTWKAKYEAEMMKHGDHKVAVSQADTAVAESVGSGSDMHLGSAYQQSRSELMKSMTQFGSFFNSVIYQRYKRANIRGDRVGLLMALSAQPIILGVLAAVVTMDIPEDEEELPGWFFEKWGSQLAGMYPFVRDIYAAWQGFNKRGIIPGAASAPVKIAEGITAIVDDEPDTAAGVSSDLIRGTATLVSLPGAGQVARVLDFIDSDSQGKEQSEFKYYQMLVEGKDRNE